MCFDELKLSAPLLRAVAEHGYTTPTAIQKQAIPLVLEGRDVLGCAQTGTGKTAAFALPILQRLSAPGRASGTRRRAARCLVLCPTRELALQIADEFRAYSRHLDLAGTVIFGGVNQNPQVARLRDGVDVIIATPGRLLDLMNQGHVDLTRIETLVLDEADRMLDMGFIHDIRKIVAQCPTKRQTLLFSATIPPEIRTLAGAMLTEPAQVKVASVSPMADRIDHSVYFVERQEKTSLLAGLVNDLPMSRAIVFTRTKHGADRVVRQLHQLGIRSEAIHGNKSQNARQRALLNFKSNRIGVLVATDIAARGIDVDGISHVVNYDLTHEPDTYVHRIGRTARAGAAGVAISLCDRDEMDHLRSIERHLRLTIPVHGDRPAFATTASGSMRRESSSHVRTGSAKAGASRRSPARPGRWQRANTPAAFKNGRNRRRARKPALGV